MELAHQISLYFKSCNIIARYVNFKTNLLLYEIFINYRLAKY